MKYLLSALFSLLVLVTSTQALFAQTSSANILIEGKSSFIKKGLSFDPYQHSGLILLSDVNKNYSLKSKAIKTSEASINNATIKNILNNVSSDKVKAISSTVLTKNNTQISFLVINDTDKNLWVIDLSPSIFLPVTNYKKIEIYNAIDNKKLATLNSNQGKQLLSLKKATPYVFTISFEQASNNFGNHSLNLYSYGSAHDTVTLSYIEILFTVLAISILIASLIFALHFPLSISIPSVIGWGIFSIGNLINSTSINVELALLLPPMFVIWLPFIMFSLRRHLQLSQAPTLILSTNMIALLFSVVMAITSVVSSSNIIGSSTGVLNYVIFATFVISCLFSLSSSILAIISKSTTCNIIIMLGWSGILLGSTITAISLTDYSIVPASQTSLSLYSISVVFFGLCWIIFSSDKIKSTCKTSLKSSSNNNTISADPMSQKLFEAREGFDNTRLVQVLKRERVIMQELRDKDIQLTKDMKEEKEKADYANKAKSSFLAVISHEIRTPMTGIMGMVRLLRNSNLNNEQDDHVNTISDSGDAMVALLNDILDFEKIDTGKMKLEVIEFDLYNLLKNVQSLLVGRTDEKNIALKLEIDETTPQYVQGDPTRLRQILLNLITNAIKFTDNGHVSIQTKVIEQKDDDIQLYFAIQDTGLGIPKEAQENLFNPFAQADSTTSRKYGGSGLGLAICQKLVNQMGGEININSAPNEGSNFFFSITIPLGKENDAGAMIPPVISAPAQVKKEPEKKPKPSMPQIKPQQIKPTANPFSNTASQHKIVMVVDDNDINQKVMSGFISPLGHTVHNFNSGQKAVDALKEDPNKFDLVFMDIEMPGISGVETTRIIREELKIDKATLPIIALTGNTGEEEVASYMAIGMTGFIAKPIDADALEEVLSSKKIETKKTSQTATTSIKAIKKPEPKEKKLKEKTPVEKNLEDHAHKTILTNMDTGLTIDEPTQEEKKAVEDSNYNPADFDSSTLMTLKASIKQEELSSMVSDLISKLNEFSQQIQASVASGKFDIVRARAHDLKGMAGNFGLVGISNRASMIEDSIKSAAPNEATLKKLSSSLQEDVKQANTYLTKWL